MIERLFDDYTTEKMFLSALIIELGYGTIIMFSFSRFILLVVVEGENFKTISFHTFSLNDFDDGL